MMDQAELKRDLWKKLSQSPFLLVGLVAGGEHSEPLTAQLDKDQADTLWFFVGRENRLAKGGKAMAHFASKGHDYFASLSGEARACQDKGMIDKLWSRQVEAWFPGGKDDPNLLLLRFDIDSAELWETDMSLTGKLKMLFGGKINPSEEGSHARVAITQV